MFEESKKAAPNKKRLTAVAAVPALFFTILVLSLLCRFAPIGAGAMYVVSNDGKYVYGFATAEDTGVRGNIIDLYMNTYSECVQFGVRDCTVYILD